MTILKILKYPNKRLRKIAKPVKIINSNIRKIIQDMFDTMHENSGIGLAATQVDIHLQIIVINNIEDKNFPLVLINPKLIEKSGTVSIKEGCLSIPKKRALILRSNYIKIHALNYYGKRIELEADSLLSICIQHEMDHLLGKLFIDYLESF